MEEKLRFWQAFARTLCEAMDTFAYVTVGHLNEGGETLSFGSWAGKVIEGTTSKASQVAYRKMGELVVAGAGRDGKLIMTPIPDLELSDHWMGGAAQDGRMVLVSKWRQEHDRMLALLTLYNALHAPLTLHHAGFRFPNRETYRIENALLGSNGMERPAADHERTYFAGPGYYRELQWFPDGPHDRARHWDVVCEEPEKLLRFVAEAYGQEFKPFGDSGPNDPIGVVWATDSDGDKLGIMARPKWWKV